MHHPHAGTRHAGVDVAHDSPFGWIRSPYGKPGDLLYVRETWRPRILGGVRGKHMGFGVQFREGFEHKRTVCYARQFADCTVPTETGDLVSEHWKPSVHMPRWAARIWLRVTDVRGERVQEIGEDDAEAEGVDPWHLADLNATWAENPWVWVVTFERIEKPQESDHG